MAGAYTLHHQVVFAIFIWFTLVAGMIVTALWTNEILGGPQGNLGEGGWFRLWDNDGDRRSTVRDQILQEVQPKSACNRENDRIRGFAMTKPQAIEGTVQRLDRPSNKVEVVSAGQVMRFLVDSNSHLWFDGAPATLRSFHPQDHVKVIYVESEWGRFIRAMYSSDRQGV